MPVTTILKKNVVDDLDPNLSAPAASRIFPVSFYQLNGEATDRVVFKARAVKGPVQADAATASETTFTARLWLYTGGAWVAMGQDVTGVQSNRLASSYIGGSTTDVTVDGFLQITSISNPGADATGFVMSLYESDATIGGPRTEEGFPEVSLVGAIPLPAGAATAANQLVEIARLTSIQAAVEDLLTIFGPHNAFNSSTLDDHVVITAGADVLYAAGAQVDESAPDGTYYVQLIDAAAADFTGNPLSFLAPPIQVVHVNGTTDSVDFSAFIPSGGLLCASGAVVQLSTSRAVGVSGGNYLIGGGAL